MTKATDLKTRYLSEIAPELKKKLGIKNTMAIPKITKVVLNSGIGTYAKNHNKDYSNVVDNLGLISGQKAVTTKAKKSISNFKTREGEVIGVMVTLRGKRMWDFLTKLVNIVFPRVRDFRGIPKKSFDGHGNYAVGFKEHTVFPEISPDEVTKLHGLEVIVCTNAGNNEKAFELLSALGFPFRK